MSKLNLSKLAVIHEGKPMTNSLTIAKYFEKRHDNILRDIRNLECSSEFREHNFVLSNYTNKQDQIFPMYNITLTGFIE